jgi:PAS domain S-box-containing protein
VILFTQYNRGPTGRVTVAYEVEGLIAQVANAPVFGLYDFTLHNGGLGGSVISVQGLGEATGQAALALLTGKQQLTQPVTVTANRVVPMVEWRQIERWGGDASRLPEGTVILHRPPSLWAQYQGYILAALALLGMQAVLITGLLVQRRHRAEANVALRASEQRLRLVHEAAQAGTWEWDLRTDEKVWSAGLWKLYGLDPQSRSAVYEAWRQTIHPEDRAQAEQAVQTAAHQGTALHAEWRVRHPDGEERWLMSRGQPVCDAEGRTVRYLGIALDITERKQAEEALRVRTQQLEAIRAVSAEITQELELPTLLTLIHRHATELLGTGMGTLFLWDEATQLLVPRVWHGLGDGTRELRMKLGEGAAGTVAQRREGLIVNDFRSSPYITPLLLERTRHIGVIVEPLIYGERLLGVISVDTTDPGRRFTDQDQQLLRLLADQAAIAIENARLFAASARAAREARSLYEIAQSVTTSLDPLEVLHLIVLKTTELLGTPHAQVTLWDEETQTLRLGAAYGTEAEKVKGQEFRLGTGVNGIVAQTRAPLVVNDYQAFPHRVAGLTELVADIGVPLIYRGRLLGVLNSHATQPGSAFATEHLALLTGFATQATIAIENARLYEASQRYATELEGRVRERTAELDAARRAAEAASLHKSAFLANMSHELRTPLNSILGFAQLLQEQTKELFSTKQTRFLTNIYTSGQHLLTLINDILDLSKVEAGKITLERVPLAVAEILEDLLVIARGLAHKKGQTIQVEIASDLPALTADPVRFKQIFFNLVSNAVKFTPDGGTVTVTARRICDFQLPIADVKSIGPEPQSQIANRKSEMLELAVADTGAGIRPEDLPKLFREFTQLETTAAQAHEGTGLGLALTKRLVELHGGTITASSDGEGQGSTFTVRLPMDGRETGDQCGGKS